MQKKVPGAGKNQIWETGHWSMKKWKINVWHLDMSDKKANKLKKMSACAKRGTFFFSSYIKKMHKEEFFKFI